MVGVADMNDTSLTHVTTQGVGDIAAVEIQASTDAAIGGRTESGGGHNITPASCLSSTNDPKDCAENRHRRKHQQKSIGVDGNGAQRQTRSTCPTCRFPPRTCVCSALPISPLADSLRKCRIVVLQHPHELRRKNRSLPLVELCLLGCGVSSETKNNCESHGGGEGGHSSCGKTAGVPVEGNGNNPSYLENQGEDNVSDTEMKQKTVEEKGSDFAFRTVVGRRFGDDCETSVMNILRDPNEVIVLVFPHDKAIPLDVGITEAERRCKIDRSVNQQADIDLQKHADSGEDPQYEKEDPTMMRKKITLVFLDATWKHAREMDRKTEAAGEWPEGMIRVQLTPTASVSTATGEPEKEESTPKPSASDNGLCTHALPDAATESTTQAAAFVHRRFEIRAPPSPDHLSTAECLAWIVSRVEGEPSIYETIMKPLDYMVRLWKSFSNAPNNDGRRRAGGEDGGGDRNGLRFTCGDGSIRTGTEEDAGKFSNRRKNNVGGKNDMSQKRRKIKS